MLATIVYLVPAATVLAPVDEHGARTTHLTIHSKAVGRDLGVNGNEAVFRGLARLGGRAPVIAFPDGGEHSYWHNRPEGSWGRYVMREVIPTVSRRFGIDPHRVAIGGISMGGFGAYDLALLHPGRFCAVGGHSPALLVRRRRNGAGSVRKRRRLRPQRRGRDGAWQPGRVRRDAGLERLRG